MTDVATRVESTGFYAGQNRLVAVAVKVVVVSLVLWASLAPDAGAILMEIQAATISYFRGWYVYASGLFMVMALLLAVVPKTARIRLGAESDRPEFSRLGCPALVDGQALLNL